jgi:hypothetical protein
MQTLKRYKKWIIGIGLFIVGFILYGMFFTDTTSERGGGLVTSTVNNGTQNGGVSQGGDNVISAQIISALNQIESLRLDRSIFDDAVYRSLRDRSRELREESVGKANPFDPINTTNLQFNQGGNTQANPEDQAGDATAAPAQTGPRGPQTIINTSRQAI